MVGVIQRGIDSVGASGSDVGALFCGGDCQRPFTHLPALPGSVSLGGQHESAQATGTALVGLVDAGRQHLRNHGQFWLAVRTVWESTFGSVVSPALESVGHQPCQSASLDQLDLWPLCLNVFDAQELRRDLDAVSEPLQSSRLCAKRPSCQSVVKTTNPKP